MNISSTSVHSLTTHSMPTHGPRLHSFTPSGGLTFSQELEELHSTVLVCWPTLQVAEHYKNGFATVEFIKYARPIRHI